MNRLSSFPPCTAASWITFQKLYVSVMSSTLLLTFLGNESGQLLSSFCHHKRTGTVFHRTKADLSALFNSFCKEQPEVKGSPCNSVSDSMHKVIKNLLSQSKENERYTT